MNKRLSSKELSYSAKFIKDKLKRYNGKLLDAKTLNNFVKLHLKCSLRTAQRTIKELQQSKKVTCPKAYRITLKY